MNSLYIQTSAEKTVLEFKLNKIKEHVNKRLSQVDDAVVKNELILILNIISEYTYVPAGWKLPEPLVPIKEEDKE